MIAIALDTNRVRDWVDGDRAVIELLETVDDLFIPFFVVAELRVGFAGGDRRAANERKLLSFLSVPGVSVLMPDMATTHHYAAVWRALKRIGKPIPNNDVWIAALCVQHGVPLYTRDRHFGHVPDLAVL